MPTQKVLHPLPRTRGDAEPQAPTMYEIFARLMFPFPHGASRQTRATSGLARDLQPAPDSNHRNLAHHLRACRLRYQRKA